MPEPQTITLEDLPPWLCTADLRWMISRTRDPVTGKRRGVTYATVYNWRKKGYLKFIKIGRIYFYPTKMVLSAFGIDPNEHVQFLTSLQITVAGERMRTFQKLKDDGVIEKHIAREKARKKLVEATEELEAINRERIQRE